MTKKEIVEKIKQNMPKFTGTEDEIEVKTALYIYIELGKMKSFDEKYYFGNSSTKKKIYSLAQKEEKNPDLLASKKKLICVSLTHLYINILKEFGIEAIASMPDEGGHIYPIIRQKNGQKFKADLQQDLENIQTKSRLQNFEYMGNMQKTEKINSNQEEITKMLIELGYISDEKNYKDETIQKIKEKIKYMNPHEALKTILEDEELYNGNEDMESAEVDKFYVRSLKKIVPNLINKKIYVFNCYRDKENQEKDYTLCCFSEESDIKIYLFSKRDKRFLRVDANKMGELQKEGLNLGAKPKENGANKLKKYIAKLEQKQTIILR